MNFAAESAGQRGHTAAGRRARVRILRASMEMTTEVGFDGVRVAEIARRVNMSSGQVMYYFATKEQILLETLSWCEQSDTEQRRVELPTVAVGWPRLRRFVELYLPRDLNDPVWIMWMEAWARAPHSKEVTDFLNELMLPWRGDLAWIVEQGIATGNFEPPRSVATFSTRFCALLDGLAIFRLRENPELTSSELVDLAMLTARAELGRRGPEPDPGGES